MDVVVLNKTANKEKIDSEKNVVVATEEKAAYYKKKSK